MKKIFLDTNFLIDYILRSEYKTLCEDFLEDGTEKGRSFYISYLSVANFAYIARKIPLDELYNYLATISELFNIIENNKSQLTNSILLRTKDFEDGLQYFSAKAENCDCIITRNQKDFSFSDIPVMSAQEFLDSKIL